MTHHTQHPHHQSHHEHKESHSLHHKKSKRLYIGALVLLVIIVLLLLIRSAFAYTNNVSIKGEPDQSQTISVYSQSILIAPGKWRWTYTITASPTNRSAFSIDAITIGPHCPLAGLTNLQSPTGWSGQHFAYPIEDDPQYENNKINWRVPPGQPLSVRILPGESRTFSFDLNRDADNPEGTFAAISGGGAFNGKTMGCTKPPLNPLPPPPASVSCPLAVTQTNQIIVEFNKGQVGPSSYLKANGTPAESEQSKAVGLAKGDYKVSLVSFDTHDVNPQPTQDKEIWKIIMRNAAGTLVATTLATEDLRDLEKSQTYNLGTVVNADEPVTEVVAKHDAYQDPTSSQDIVPVCALFEKQLDPPLPDPPKTGKLIFNTNIWLGNASITQGNTFIRPDQLAIAGKDIAAGLDGVHIANYQNPKAGKINWDTFFSDLKARVIRAQLTGGGTQYNSLGCNNAIPLSELYLDNTRELDGTPISTFTDQRSEEEKKVVVLFLRARCKFTLASGAKIHGKGFIVNAKMPVGSYTDPNKNPDIEGGEIEFQGPIKMMDPDGFLGYISFNKDGDTKSGQVVLKSGAELERTVIITEGSIMVEPNRSNKNTKHEAIFIGKNFVLPSSSELTADIEFAGFPGLDKIQHFLLQQTLLPSGKETQ
jgi:hypothetical protein